MEKGFLFKVERTIPLRLHSFYFSFLQTVFNLQSILRMLFFCNLKASEERFLSYNFCFLIDDLVYIKIKKTIKNTLLLG